MSDKNPMRLDDHPVMRAVRSAGIEGARIVIGVSGGADSVALLRAAALMKRQQVVPVAVHLDHGVRSESDSDAKWVQNLASSLGINVAVERQDVRSIAERQDLGLEEAARRCRYDLIVRAARDHDCRIAAVAHTADDQAETILHHLLRGTGLAGLRGMPAARELDGVTLLRPLLSVSRSDVLDFLNRLDQPHLVDKSNDDEAFTRNRIRHSLLPMLREQFNPRVSEALARVGEQARATSELIEERAARLLSEAIVQREPGQVVLRLASLADANRHLVREAFRILFVEQGWPRQQMGFDDWDQLADLARTSGPPRSLTLPGRLSAAYRSGSLTIERSVG